MYVTHAIEKPTLRNASNRHFGPLLTVTVELVSQGKEIQTLNPSSNWKRRWRGISDVRRLARF